MYKYDWSLCCRVTHPSAGEGIILTAITTIIPISFALTVQISTLPDFPPTHREDPSALTTIYYIIIVKTSTLGYSFMYAYLNRACKQLTNAFLTIQQYRRQRWEIACQLVKGLALEKQVKW